MSYFGSLLNYKLEPASVPFLIDRNVEGYRLNPLISKFSSQNDFLSSLWNENLYYKNKQRDFPINGSTLINCLLEDKLEMRQKQLKSDYNSRNSVLGNLCLFLYFFISLLNQLYFFLTL